MAPGLALGSTIAAVDGRPVFGKTSIVAAIARHPEDTQLELSIEPAEWERAQQTRGGPGRASGFGSDGGFSDAGSVRFV
jgi:hypothetical protein